VTEPESAPAVGSRTGRYLIIREVAQGALGSLFIAEREVGEGVTYGLARVVKLPSELPANEEQALADAIWDSAHLTHELVLRVADVVTGNGWVTLVHEHSEGSLISYLQSCTRQTRGAFPAKVASRVALDVIEGLEQSRDLCASAGIPWRPGSVSPGSLLLGPDGRVRALDGQITAAALRVPTLRQRPGIASHAAPEFMDDAREPGERSDVFAVGVLLWELLTGQTLFVEPGSSASLGRGFKIPKVAQSVPVGTKVPQGLVHTVHTALEADPSKRQSSLRELAVAIVMGVEDVSTYEQVLEFTDGLLLSTPANAPAPATDAPVSAADAASSVSPTAPMDSSVASPMIFSVENPVDATVQVSVHQTKLAPSVGTEEATHVEQPIEQPSLLDSARASQAPHVGDPQDEITGQRPAVTTTPAMNDAVAQQGVGGYRQKLGTLPGQGEQGSEGALGTVSSVASASPVARTDIGNSTVPREPSKQGTASVSPASSAAMSSATASVSPASSTTASSAGPFRLVHDEPIIPIAIKPVQVVGAAEPPVRTQSQYPSSSPPASVAPAAAASVRDASLAPKRTVQLSMGTIVFGILTTVLAVVVVMMLLQRSHGNAAETPAVSAPSRVGVSTGERIQQQNVAAAEAVVPERVPAPAPIVDAGIAAAVVAKSDHHKHVSATPNKTSGKPAPVEGDPYGTDSKTTEQPNRHFIPNEL
jgi:serine/threonine protein kinase